MGFTNGMEDTMENLVVVESLKPFDDACLALERAIAEHRFGILHVHDVRQTLASKGIPFDHPVRIFDVCNPQRAKQALEANAVVAAALPCAIAVFTEGGRTKFAFVRPTVMLGLFGILELRSLAADVERSIRAIVESAAS